MLRASLVANAEILPLARQGSYFFNRVGRNWPFVFSDFSMTFFKISKVEISVSWRACH
jgi:hypothetical protein